jgi:hypothetical protein
MLCLTIIYFAIYLYNMINKIAFYPWKPRPDKPILHVHEVETKQYFYVANNKN